MKHLQESKTFNPTKKIQKINRNKKKRKKVIQSLIKISIHIKINLDCLIEKIDQIAIDLITNPV